MGRLKASASGIEITPPVGTYLTGYGIRTEPAKSVHDPLMARGILLNDGKTSLLIISCDLLGFDTASVAEMREDINRKTSIPVNNILIACTHTHSGPATAKFRGAMGHVNVKWLKDTKKKIADMASELPKKLQPASFGYSSKTVSGIGFNRQDKSKPIDEELTIIAINDENGKSVATIMNYSTHAVILGANLEISGDFPGEACRHLQKLRGGIACYLQGASGDAEPLTQIEFGWGKGGFASTKRIGELLANEANDSAKKIITTDNTEIRIASSVINLPLENPPSLEELMKIKNEYLEERNKAINQKDEGLKILYEGMLEWADDMERHLNDGTVPKELPSEIFVGAINDLRIIAIPFEPYTDIALELKRRLNPLKAIVSGYSNGLFGYISPRWAKAQGGYGPNEACRWFPSMLTPLAEGADEILIEESAKLALSL